MTTRNWRADFSAAASTFDWPTLAQLSREYAAALYASPDRLNSVDQVLQLLRENLRYEDLEVVADAALAFEIESPSVRRQYAQALVDGGNPVAALTLYESVVADGDAPAGTGSTPAAVLVAATRSCFLPAPTRGAAADTSAQRWLPTGTCTSSTRTVP